MSSNALKFCETLESMESYKYWKHTMDQIYKSVGDADMSYTIEILDQQSIEEHKDPEISDYWRDTMSQVYELYPDMAK